MTHNAFSSTQGDAETTHPSVDAPHLLISVRPSSADPGSIPLVEHVSALSLGVAPAILAAVDAGAAPIAARLLRARLLTELADALPRERAACDRYWAELGAVVVGLDDADLAARLCADYQGIRDRVSLLRDTIAQVTGALSRAEKGEGAPPSRFHA